MVFSSFDTIYSQADWRILELAHRKACALLGRDPRFDPLAERVALTVMTFFERGERDFGRLARMAAKREHRLVIANKGSEQSVSRSTLFGKSDRPRNLH